MKTILKPIALIVLFAGLISSCTDDDQLYVAKAPAEGELEISSSTTSVVLNGTDAESEIALAINWGEVSYGVDTPATYTLQMDVEDGDFSSEVRTFDVTGQTEKAFTHADLNFYALSFGIPPSEQGKVKMRLKTSLKFDNLVAYSEPISVLVTPYSTLNLLYDMPEELYLQGDAVPSNWGTPVTESQKMTQIDDHRFGLITELIGGKNYAFILTPTVWSDPAYVGVEGGQSPLEGDFRPAGSTTEPQWGGEPLSSPENTGIYKIILNFTTGKYSVTPASSILTPPEELYIIGDATALGWADNVDDTQKFTKISEHTFEITLPLSEGGVFAFITATSYSDPAYKTNTTTQDPEGGDIIASGSATNPAWGGNDIVAPASGTYTITVNFKSGTYILKR